MRVPRGILLTVGLVAVLLAPGTASADLGSTTTINGAVPSGTPAPLTNMSVMLDTVQADGNQLLITQGVRKPGTRAPIHLHDFGGNTCVLSGTITNFVEGNEPTTYRAGTCYYMAPDVPMTAANLGTEDVRLIDSFIAPPGAPAIIVLEPGWPDLTDPTG